MAKKLSFRISQAAAAAVHLPHVQAIARSFGIHDRIQLIVRNDTYYVACSEVAADFLLELFQARAVARGTTPEELIACATAIQAIHEVYDPRVAPHRN